MPRNSSGIYSLPAGNPVAAGTVITDDWANTTMQDIADALTQSLSRDGQGGFTGPTRFEDGTEGLPGIAWINEFSTGLYRAALGDMRVSVLGQDLFRWYDGDVYVWDDVNDVWQRVVASNNITVNDDGSTTFEGDVILEDNLQVNGDTNIAGDLVVAGDIISGGGGAGSASAFRYYRMTNMVKMAGLSSAKIAEIRFRAGDVDIQTTASFQAYNSSGAPVGFATEDNINDGLVNDNAVIPGTVLDGSMVWDFGTPVRVDYIAQYLEDANIGIKDFHIEVSNNGTDWTFVKAFTDTLSVPNSFGIPQYIFSEPQPAPTFRPYKFYRFQVLEASGVGPGYQVELGQIFMLFGENPVQFGASVTLNNIGGIDNPARIVDGDTATVFDGTVASEMPDYAYIDIELTVPWQLTSVAQFAAGSGGMKNYLVWGGDDANTFTLLASFDDGDAAAGLNKRNYFQGIGDAPADGTTYGRNNNAWTAAGGGDWTYDTTIITAGPPVAATAGTWHFVDDGAAIFSPASPSVGDRFAVSCTLLSTSAENVIIFDDAFGGVMNCTYTLVMDPDDLLFGGSAAGFIYLGGSVGWAPLFSFNTPLPFSVG